MNGRRKMQGQPRDKMQRPDGNKAKQELQALVDQVQAGQQILSSEEADELIGTTDEAYRALIQATRAQMTMGWMMAKSQGARSTSASLRMQAQGMVVMLDLVHKAYAAGVRRGREGM